MRNTISKEQKAAEFAREHWKETLAVSATLAGAVIFLLIKYHQKRRTEANQPIINSKEEKDLQNLAEDARLSDRDANSLIIDLAPDLKRHIPDMGSVTEELAETLSGEIVQTERDKRRGRRRREKPASPKDLMQLLGKVHK